MLTADIEVVICDKVSKVETMLQRVKETPQLKIVVVMEQASEELLMKCKDCGLELMQFSDLEVGITWHIT